METFEFKFYKSYTETFDNLTDEQSGKLLKRMYKFYFENIDDKSDNITEAVFSQIKFIMLKSLKGKETGGVKKKTPTTTPTTTPHTKDKDKDKDKEQVKDKNIYGIENNVKLNKEEYNKIKDKYGINILEKYIDDLSLYILKEGDKYSNHYLTLLNWIRKNNEQEIKKPIDWKKIYS